MYTSGENAVRDNKTSSAGHTSKVYVGVCVQEAGWRSSMAWCGYLAWVYVVNISASVFRMR